MMKTQAESELNQTEERKLTPRWMGQKEIPVLAQEDGGDNIRTSNGWP